MHVIFLIKLIVRNIRNPFMSYWTIRNQTLIILKFWIDCFCIRCFFENELGSKLGVENDLCEPYEVHHTIKSKSCTKCLAHLSSFTLVHFELYRFVDWYGAIDGSLPILPSPLRNGRTDENASHLHSWHNTHDKLPLLNFNLSFAGSLSRVASQTIKECLGSHIECHMVRK